MKLYIKQKIFSFKDKYQIYDSEQRVVYDVDGEMFTLGSKLHLYNIHGQEEYFIKQRLSLFLAKYEIYKNNNLCATVNQEFSMFKARLNVESTYGQFTFKGNFMSMDYEILRNGQYFGSIHKKWLSWGDSYELDIPDSENAGFFCALVIAIDNCLHNGNNN